MNNVISSGIVKDTLKKILPISIVFCAVVTVISAISVFFNNWLYQGIMGAAPVIPFDLFEFSPLIVLFATVGVPVFVLVANSYMTKRADADFYDALPHTRTQTALSSMTAVFISASVITLLAFGVAIGSAYLFTDELIVPWRSSIFKLFALILIEYLTIAVFSLACAITGTTFSALAVGFLIIEGPRTLMALINDAVASTSPVLVSKSVVPLFDNSYNLYTAISASNNAPLSTPHAYIYTAIIAIIYTLLAIFAFNKRKSESATHPAPSKAAQHVYRISVSTLISSVALYLLFGYGFDIGVAIILFLSVVVYFGYELITTKRAKNLLGALAAFPIFILINALIAGGIALGSHIEGSYTPDADDVDSISIVLPGENTYVDLDEYVTLMSEKIAITDIETITIVTDALRENVAQYEAGTYLGTYISQASDYHYTTVKIKSGVRTEYRNVYIPINEYLTVIDKLSESDGYRELWYKLPENPEILNAEYGSLSFGESAARDVYETVRAEIINLGYDAWVELYNTAEYEDVSLSIYFDVTVGGEQITVYIHVPTELQESYTKAEAAKDLLMREKKSETLSLLSEFLSDDGEELYLMVDVWYNGEIYDALGYRSEFQSSGSAEEFVTFISSMITDEYASYNDNSYIDISLTRYTDNRKSVNIVCKIADGITAEQIKNMFAKYGYVYE